MKARPHIFAAIAQLLAATMPQQLHMGRVSLRTPGRIGDVVLPDFNEMRRRETQHHRARTRKSAGKTVAVRYGK